MCVRSVELSRKARQARFARVATYKRLVSRSARSFLAPVALCRARPLDNGLVIFKYFAC